MQKTENVVRAQLGALGRKRMPREKQRMPGLLRPSPGQTPPADLYAEGVVLGALLTDHRELANIGSLSPEHFYSGPNQEIFRAILDISEEGRPPDMPVVVTRLVERKLLEQVGGSVYLCRLQNEFPAVPNLSVYVDIIRERFRLRELILTAKAIVGAGYGVVENVQEFADNAYQKFFDLAMKGPSTGEAILKTLLRDWYVDAQTEKSGLKTRLRAVNALLPHGLLPGQLVVLGARPAVGKSALAHGLCADWAARGHAGLLFSLEMSNTEICTRLVVAESGVPEAGQSAASRADTVAALQDWPLIVDDTPSVTIDYVRSVARRVAAKQEKSGGPALAFVVVDHIHLMEGPGPSEQTAERVISGVTKSLKALAKELGIVVLALGQLNRNVEHRDKKTPQLSDLRSSGSAEQDADIVLLLHRDDCYRPPSKRDGMAELAVAKNRNGQTGMARLRFLPQLTRFEDEDDYCPDDLDDGLSELKADWGGSPQATRTAGQPA